MKKYLVILMAIIGILATLTPTAAMAAETPCELELPEEVTVIVNFANPLADPPDPSYFPSLVISGGTIGGTYDGWCVDWRDGIYEASYDAYVYNSYCGDDLTGIVEIPGNIDLVNWILNNYQVGTAIDSLGNITYGDIQAAIWQLLNSTGLGTNLGVWDQGRVDLIKAAAYAHDGFIPGCGESVLIVLDPYVGYDSAGAPHPGNYQPLCILLPLVCEPVCYSETAWAYGAEADIYFGDETDTVFHNNKVDGNTSDAWGWTNYFDDEEVDFPVVMELWAAAGQNNTDNGYLVGTVTVDFDGDDVTVNYNVTAPYTIAEVHLWVGDTPLPTETIKRGKTTTTIVTASPGQFDKFVEYAEYELDETSAMIKVVDVDSPFYVAAHAVIEWCE